MPRGQKQAAAYFRTGPETGTTGEKLRAGAPCKEDNILPTRLESDRGCNPGGCRTGSDEKRYHHSPGPRGGTQQECVKTYFRNHLFLLIIISHKQWMILPLNTLIFDIIKRQEDHEISYDLF